MLINNYLLVSYFLADICARHGGKSFKYIISFNSHNETLRSIIIPLSTKWNLK